MVELKVINGRIKKIGNGEKTFREEMSAISRELLVYVPETGDIDAVNRLMSKLTPKNFEVAKQYFNHFLAHNFKDGVFGKKSTNRDVVHKKINMSAEFLKDEANDIWAWINRDKEPKKRPAKDYFAEIQKLVSKSIDQDTANNISAANALKASIGACLAGGYNLEAMMDIFIGIVEEAKADNNKEEENEMDDAA